MTDHTTHTTAHPAPQKPKKNKKQLIIAAVAFGVAIALFLAVWIPNLIERNKYMSRGIETTAVSTDKVVEGRERIRRTYKTVYNHEYYYTVNERQYRIVGEKDYDNATDITAGKEVKVRYLPENPRDAMIVEE